MISRNNVIVAWTPFTLVSRSSVMSLIITFMFEPAKLQMNWASASGARNLRGDSTEGPGIDDAPLAGIGVSVIGRWRSQARGSMLPAGRSGRQRVQELVSAP